ncbi:hypothetical protein C0J52_04663 [Blattella germanica]|nr:hypothetical protein C0J52_04663 [Blattella germanica]
MSSISISPKRRRDGTKSKFKVMGNHTEFLSRIKKTLYYGKLPITERFSLPVTELAAELFSEVKNGRSLERLDLEEAAAMSRNACVSPCSLVLALLYLERLKTCNPEYLQRVAPSELFLVSMVSAVCLTSYTASVLTLIGSAFIVSQIPGIPMSTSVSSSTCDMPSTHVQETPIASPDQPFSPSVNVLTTSLILASLSSCPSENSTKSPTFTCGCSKEITCYCQNYPMNTSDNIVYEHSNTGNGLTELVSEWAKHISWEWWKMKLEQLFSNSYPANASQNQGFTSRRRSYKSDDSLKRVGLGSHSRQTDDGNNVQDENEQWIAEIRNWLDQTALERSSQTKFFPLEITSNY